MTATDDGMDAVWTSLRILLLAIGVAMASAGLGSSKAYAYIMVAAGSVSAIGSAAWGVWTAIRRAAQKRQDMAKAVAAGINLVVAGQALTGQGALLQVANPDSTPPKPVTEKSAAEIIKSFAPTEAPKAA
jgi:hypothetical protein